MIDLLKLGKRVKGLRKTGSRRSLILMYHRVAERDIDPWALAVSPANFAEQMEVIASFTRPLHLSDLAKGRQAGDLPERAVSVTFDDGYANNLYRARLILEKYHIPATVFVTTGYTENGREFWWDELEQILFQAKPFPETLHLSINGNTREWPLGKAVNYTETEYAEDVNTRVWSATPGSRMQLYHQLWETLRMLPEAERRVALDRLADWAGIQPTLRPEHRPMTARELRQLAASRQVSIGAHTVHHPLLSSLSPIEQKEEIVASKVYLEKLLGHPVRSISYPFGGFDEHTLSLVMDAGFDLACTIREETVWRQSDSLQLPRFNVLDWNGAQFEKQLKRWLTY